MNKKYYAIISLVVMALVVAALFNLVKDDSEETDNYVTFDLVDNDSDPQTAVGSEAAGVSNADSESVSAGVSDTDSESVSAGVSDAGSESVSAGVSDAGSESVSAGTSVANSGSEAASESAGDVEPAETVYVFRNSRLLNEHYEKHGIEMGFASAAEYEAAASAVINNPAALFKTEKEDGDYIYYLEDTNEFVVLSTDGYIRTYFNPSSGKAYFDRQ